MSDESNEQESKRPAATFSGSGGLKVAVWKHKAENEGRDRYSVRVERSYKDGEEFKSTQYLRDADLLRVQRLLAQADDWIEQDKGRVTSRAVGQQR